MEKIYGTTRVVFVFSHLVIKLPRQKDFMNNLMINFQEFLFYLFYRPTFCMPTYFSFLGLLNIQKRGDEVEKGYLNEKARYLILNILDIEIGKYLNENELSLPDYGHLAHTLLGIDNLFWHKNYLKVVDYGDMLIIRFIKKNKKKLILISPD